MLAPMPDLALSSLVVPPPGAGPHQWAGAPSSALDGNGGYVLAYRVRSGYEGTDTTVVARSRDGVRFETAAVLPQGRFAARWLERPTLLRTPSGRWRLYVCCGPTTGHRWWVEALEAESLEGLAAAPSRVVFLGDEATAVKDPVVRFTDGRWEAWLCCHMIDTPGAEDRMRAVYATSVDGWDWQWHGPVLEGKAGSWDARGVRVTGVLPDGRVFYDGRASKEENWFERSSIAAPTGAGSRLEQVDGAPVVDLRYVDVLALPGGGIRLYYEARLPDDSHELRTELVAAPAAQP